MKAKIGIVTLGVRDVDRAAAFYRTLGFPQKGDHADGYAMFRMEGTWLGLYERAALAADAGVPPGDAAFSGVTLAHCVASKAAVDETLDEARAAGARIARPGRDAEWGGYSGYFADPDGHLWEVAWNPFTDLA